jgi:colanic acid/amylovoran biosynthesis glycosyltransferase
MKTINIFVNSFPKTSETFIYNKVKMLLINGFKINLIVSEIEKNSTYFYEDISEFNNFKIVLSPLSRTYALSNILRALISLKFWKLLLKSNFNIKLSYKSYLCKKTLNLFKPDIIHFEFSGIGFNYLHYLDELKGVKIVSSFRGAAEKIKPLTNKKRDTDFPLFLKKIDACHCVSIDMHNHLKRYSIDENKVFINYPSIDLSRFNYLNNYSFDLNKEIKIISIGRLHWKKGIDLALLSLYKLKQKGFNFTYTLVGDGPEYEKLKFMTENLGLGKEVKFLGFKSSKEVSTLLLNSNLFLLPSYSEGLANSALEAMSSGIPVIAAKAGGMEEAIIHEKSGFLFEIGDVDGLYNNLLKVFENNFDLNKIRLKARETVEKKFDIKIQSEKFKTFYQNL